VIIDEAQNLERSVLLTALSRLGVGSRVVLTHDIAQRDNLRVGRHDGVVSVIDTLKGSPAPSDRPSPPWSPNCWTAPATRPFPPELA
jgi:predicted ribonuclease YlaK